MATRIVVEWTRLTARVAVAEGGGSRYRLRAIRSQALGPSGAVGEALASLLKGVKTTGAEVLGVVPREQVITRVVKFPSIQPAELVQMAEMYAKGQLPYPREQTVMDSYVLQQAEGFSLVAIVACQREAVDRQLALLREAGLPVASLTVSSWGVLGWYRDAARSGAIQEPALVLQIDDARTDLVLIAGGRILSSRSIGQGLQEWTSSSETAELLGREVERSRSSIRKELPGTDVRSLVLTGLGPLAQWKEQLAQQLALPTIVLDANLPWKGIAAQANTPISPVVIGGVAIGDFSGMLNLSPAEVRGQRRHQRQFQELAVAGGLFLAVVGTGATLLHTQVLRQQRMRAQLDEVLTEMDPDAKVIREKTRVAQFIGSILKDRRQFAGLLTGIFQRTVGGATLEVITFDRNRRELTVRGNAPSTQDVLGYIAQLEDLAEVESVELKYSTRRTTAAGERTDFELLVRQRGRSS